MESSLACVFRAQTFCSSSLLWRNGEPTSIRANRYQFCPSNYGSLRLKQLPRQSNRLWKVVSCAKGGSVSERENKLGNEIITVEELMGFGRLREKCKETVSGGIAELLECLEKEAIMGEDEGKEPTDYNRRAHIFEKSSRVFQAIKESRTTTTTTPTSTS